MGWLITYELEALSPGFYEKMTLANTPKISFYYNEPLIYGYTDSQTRLTCKLHSYVCSGIKDLNTLTQQQKKV